MKKIFFLIGLLVFLNACKHHTIYPAEPLKEQVFTSDAMHHFIRAIESHPCSAKTKVVVLDIDDTILTASGHLGTPPWFYTMIDTLRKAGIERTKAYEIMTPIDQAVQRHITPRLIEEHLPRTIEQWHKNGSIVVALTSRPDYLQAVTKKQLETVGIQFYQPVFQCIDAQWDTAKGHFSDGVLYVGPLLKKSTVFEQFLSRLEGCGQSVELIAHSDDQEKYVAELQESARTTKKSFIGQVYKKAINERRFDIKSAANELNMLITENNLTILPTEYSSLFLHNYTR